MTPPTDDLFGWLFKFIFVTVTGFLVWGKKRDKDKLDKLAEEVTKLKSEMVTEDKVRSIVTETINTAIIPLCADMAEVKKLVTSNSEITKQLQIKMAEKEGYEQAIRDLKESYRNP